MCLADEEETKISTVERPREQNLIFQRIESDEVSLVPEVKVEDFCRRIGYKITELVRSGPAQLQTHRYLRQVWEARELFLFADRSLAIVKIDEQGRATSIVHLRAGEVTSVNCEPEQVCVVAGARQEFKFTFDQPDHMKSWSNMLSHNLIERV